MSFSCNANARFSFLLSLLLLAGSAFPSSDVRAQGFSVSEQSACVMGRAGTGTAQACGDGSAMFFNPAGLTRSDGLVVSGGATLIIAEGDFTDARTGETADLENDPIPAPHLYASYGDGPWSAGVGVFVPYGLGTEWPADDFAGRFAGYDNSLQSIYLQPTAAYEIISGLSVGAGLDVVLGSVELNQRVGDLSERVATQSGGRSITFGQLGIPPGTEVADANLEGSATGFGGNVGVQWQATNRLHLGARYMTPVALDYEGDAAFEPATGVTLPAGNPFEVPVGTPLDDVIAGQFAEDGPLRDQSVATSITMPAQLSVGATVQATPALLLLADYQWIGWSSFDRINLEFDNEDLNTERVENYDNTSAFRLGAEYAFTEAFSLRGGWLYNTAAAPDETVTPLLPENDRNHYTIGLGWRPLPCTELNVAYQYLDQNDRRGRVVEPPSGQEPTTDLNSGLYSFYAHLIGATLTVRY